MDRAEDMPAALDIGGVRVGELFGRGTALGSFERLLDGARAGRGAVALVEGDAGIGKSAVIDALADRARAMGFEILAGVAHEFERAVPFAPLVAAFDCRSSSDDPERAAIARMLRPDPDVVPPPEGDRLLAPLVEAFAGIAERTAMHGPTLLVAEDLHWADPSTLVALGTIARRYPDLPLVLVASMRPSSTPDLQRLVDGLARSGATHVRLQPLAPADVRALVTSLVSADPADRLARTIEAAEGNPLFVTELIRALQADGLVRVEDGRAELTDDVLPPTLRQTILRLLSPLSDDTQAALRTASLLGTSMEASDLAALLQVGARDLDRLLDEPLREGVLISDRERLMFRHDLVRDAVYSDIPESVRQAMHREAADSLDAAGAPVVRVAQHLARGARPGDRDAIARLEEAIDHLALSGASEPVGDLLRSVRELYPRGDPGRDAYFNFEVQDMLRAGKSFGEMEATARERLRRAVTPRAEAMIRVNLGPLCWEQGKVDETMEEARRLVAIRDLPAWLRIAMLHSALSWFQAAGRHEAGRKIAAVALSLAEQTGFDAGLASIRISMAYWSFFEGSLREALSLAEDGMRSARRAGGEDWAAVQVSYFLAECDRLEEARELLARAESGPTPEMGSLGRAAYLLQTGAWDDAAAEFESIRDRSHDIERAGSANPWSAAGLALVALCAGRFDEADALLRPAEEVVARRGAQWAVDAIIGLRAEVHEATGDLAAAAGVLRDGWEIARPLRSPFVFRRVAPAAVRIALGAGDADFARAVTEDAEAWASRSGGVASAEAMALRCRGLLTGDPDILLQAVARYEEAGPRVYERALCRADAARALAGASRVDEARPLFDEAIDAFEAMGADHLAAMASAAMRDAGLRRGAKGKRQRPAAGWESLTPSELKIVALVAQGMRNAEVAERLFISPHTVSTHLRHVFGKLGLASRVELTKEFAARTGAVGTAS